MCYLNFAIITLIDIYFYVAIKTVSGNGLGSKNSSFCDRLACRDRSRAAVDDLKIMRNYSCQELQ